jgi:diguanylate cyclase (GGDEF)-like protein
MYLIAISIFFLLGSSAISLGRMAGVDTIYIEHLGLMAVTIEALLLALVLASQFAQLQVQFNTAQKTARCDPLTGLLNKRAFSDAGFMEVERSKRYDHPLAVLFLDLDHFKQLNDTQGHAAGDDAFLAVSSALLATLRSNDQLGRLGGDEFAILLPEISHDGASEAGRKILTAVNEKLKHYVPVTSSIGVI